MFIKNLKHSTINSYPPPSLGGYKFLSHCRIISFSALLAFSVLILSCASAGSGTGMTLQEAIEESAQRIAEELPEGTRIAIAGFETEHANLSHHIMEDLTSALINRRIEVTDRQNIELLEQ